MPATLPAMSDSEFEALQRIIHDASGMLIDSADAHHIESRLTPRLVDLGLDSFGQYVSFLGMGPHAQDERRELIDRIANNETSFFRNESQIHALESVIIPKLLTARGAHRRLRLWSAGCSTGEEAYTLAIIVHRTLGEQLHNWDIDILATDISHSALEMAREGSFMSMSFRAMDPALRHQFFSAQSDMHLLDDRIAQMVRFKQHSLQDHLEARRWGTWDVIVCRNVLMYLGDDLRRDTVKMFQHVLNPDGALLIGEGEETCIRGMGLVPIDLDHACAYHPASAMSANTWNDHKNVAAA